MLFISMLRSMLFFAQDLVSLDINCEQYDFKGALMSLNKPGYNERLFRKGVRRWLHEARFLWLKQKTGELAIDTRNVLEIGCFDARSLDYFVRAPELYVGLDSNWEGGLDSAKQKYRGNTNYKFVETKNPTDISESCGNIVFTLALSLETLEHISPNLLDEYLYQISKVLQGNFLVSVPNEKGLLFLAKYLTKKIYVGGARQYTFSEILYATIGRLDKVSRD